MNTFGNKLRLTTFGESHGPAMGGVIDGFPSRFKLDFEKIQEDLDRRRPGNSSAASARRESDNIEFLSGINDQGITLGTPIAFIIRNQDIRKNDYDAIVGKFRPNHADYTYFKKYGMLPTSGGGRSSARETVSWVAAGAIARQWVEKQGVMTKAMISAAGNATVDDPFRIIADAIAKKNQIETDPAILKEILLAKSECDSVGGAVSCILHGMPAGLGNPVFDKLHARLSMAMMSINAAHGFFYGDSAAVSSRGSDFADSMNSLDADFNATFSSNHCGGVLGGISTGDDIYFTVSFKPTPSIARPLPTIDCYGSRATITTTGRHDPCVAVRAVPVVEALTALVAADYMLECR